MDNRSLGSSRSGKKRLPLPSEKPAELASDGDLLSLISGETDTKVSWLFSKSNELLKQRKFHNGRLPLFDILLRQ